MKPTWGIAGLAVLLGACTSAGGRTTVEAGGEVVRAADAAVAAWPTKQREAAAKLIAKYGQPDAIGERLLVWHDEGPFVRIALHRDEQPHQFPMQHTDFLTQTVKYRLPIDRIDEVTVYDGSVWWHRTRGELSAQCDVEEMNFLALNLAHEVATAKRTVEDARAFYAKTAMEFKQGKTSDYTKGLMFQPMADAADPDKPHQM
ncbi:MAG: hypothetical protein ACT4R6_05585 [Gemmatimonadaceae bacterium]